MTRLRNVAVILAGGTGTRIGLDIPKQLIKVAGKPIIEHTISAMHQSPLVDEIVVMMAPTEETTTATPMMVVMIRRRFGGMC